eukprot:636356-Pleurochrysis_carterae.AAC.1
MEGGYAAACSLHLNLSDIQVLVSSTCAHCKLTYSRCARGWAQCTHERTDQVQFRQPRGLAPDCRGVFPAQRGASRHLVRLGMAVMAQTRHAEGTASPRQQRQALSAKRRKQERERRELKRFIEAKHEQHGYYAKMKMCKAAGVEWQYGECGPRDSPKNDKRVMTRSMDVGLKAMKKNSPRAEESKLEAPHSRRPLVARLAEMSVLAARNSPKLVRRGSSNPDLVESEARNFLK